MRRIAAYTLGCKVNQYDTEAMLEQFISAGYQPVEYPGEADVYLINTCTVTGTGDQKSLKTIRSIYRNHPDAAIIVAGCLAQRDAERMAELPGVILVIGVQHRSEALSLFEQATGRGEKINAVRDLKGAQFEKLSVVRHEGHTRAIMKIQEGCDRYCSYCIIPMVRGPVRSLPLADVARESDRLAAEGYMEIVLTGIHLASYGRDTGDTLAGAIDAVSLSGVPRIRLGSLEPPAASDAFLKYLSGNPRVMRHLHLSMQSGSDGVLKRMKRRYTSGEYMEAVDRIRRYLPGASITTDVLCGFPGETDAEAAETLEFVERVGFSKIHVFPYSRREGTAADRLPGQLPKKIKQSRAAELLSLGNKLELAYAKSMIGNEYEVLFEERVDGGCEGYTGQYVRVVADAPPGSIRRVMIDGLRGPMPVGHVIESGGHK